MKIIIAGGSGHVGQSLTPYFRARGDTVIILSRSDGRGWNGKSLGDWVETLEGADVLINLVGKSVNCRYTRKNMEEMLASRVDSTRVLGEAVNRSKSPPRLWINSSTATIYQHRFDAPNDDTHGVLASGADRMPSKWLGSIKIAHAWEAAFFEPHTPHTRKVAIRSAMVMAPIRGSVFDVLLALTRKRLMGTQGNGKQFVSWIHEVDFCRAIDWIMTHSEITGPLNVASPNPVPQREFAHDLRAAVGTKIGLPAPTPILELAAFLMRTETELLLKSRRVVPSRLLESGFEFEFPDWSDAARDLVLRSRERLR